jgi:hypothetical protein
VRLEDAFGAPLNRDRFSFWEGNVTESGARVRIPVSGPNGAGILRAGAIVDPDGKWHILSCAAEIGDRVVDLLYIPDEDKDCDAQVGITNPNAGGCEAPAPPAVETKVTPAPVATPAEASTPATDSSAEPVADTVVTAAFTACAAFEGARAGCEFKQGPSGLGYYRI